MEGFTHGISSDRVVGRAGLPVAEAVHEEVAKLCFLARDITEGWVFADLPAEQDPSVEGVVLGSSRLVRGRGKGDLQRSAEIRGELTAVGRCNRVQG